MSGAACAYLEIVDVVDLVKNDPLHISDQVRTLHQQSGPRIYMASLTLRTLYNILRRISVVMIKQLASGLICTSPVRMPT